MSTSSLPRFSASASSMTLGLSEPPPLTSPSNGAVWKARLLRWGKIGFKVFKYTWSLALLVFALVLILWGIGIGTTAFYPGSPVWLNYILFVLFLVLLGILEGTMISLSQLRKAPPSSYATGYKHTLANTKLAFQTDYLERFLMGRQICVIILVFVLARLTTVTYIPGFEGWLTTAFLQTGLFGAFIVLILGNLVPQILAAKFSILFLNFIFINIVIRFCLFVRWTGLPHACWLCARGLAAMLRLNFDGPAKTKTDDAHAAKAEGHGEGKDAGKGDGDGAAEAAGAEGDATKADVVEMTDSNAAAAAAAGTDQEDLDELGVALLPVVAGDLESTGHSAYVAGHLLDVSFKTVLPRRPHALRTMPDDVQRALALNSDRQLGPHEAELTARARLFATPAEITDLFRQANEPVPAFLLGRADNGSEPAHIAALRLLAEHDRLLSQIDASHVSAHDPASAKPVPADPEAPAPRPSAVPPYVQVLAPIVRQAELDRVKAPL